MNKKVTIHISDPSSAFVDPSFEGKTEGDSLDDELYKERLAAEAAETGTPPAGASGATDADVVRVSHQGALAISNVE